MKIAIVTGGSGGHIYPALSFSDYVKKNDNVDVVYIGNSHRMEANIIPEHGYDFYPIKNEGFEGNTFDKIYAVLTQGRAIHQARKHLKKIKPDIVFAFGGYVSLPVVLAAHSLKIKIALHEQNAFVGKANKWSSRYADVIFTCYEEAFKGEDNVYLYGNPRGSLAVDQEKNDKEINRIGLNPNKPIVLVVMGSQGSQSVNKMFKKSLDNFKPIDYQLLFVSGPLEYDELMDGIEDIPNNVFIESFVDQGSLLPYLDLIVARAGASSIAEIASFGVPSILIPSPYVANNHQYYNALALQEKHATILLEEKTMTQTSFFKTIEDTLNDEQSLKELSENVKIFNTPNVNKDIYRMIKRVIEDE